MQQKKFIAKEYLRFLGFFLGTLVLLFPLAYILEGTEGIRHLLDAMFYRGGDFLLPWLLCLVPYCLYLFVRSIIWAVKASRSKTDSSMAVSKGNKSQIMPNFLQWLILIALIGFLLLEINLFNFTEFSGGRRIRRSRSSTTSSSVRVDKILYVALTAGVGIFLYRIAGRTTDKDNDKEAPEKKSND